MRPSDWAGRLHDVTGHIKERRVAGGPAERPGGATAEVGPARGVASPRAVPVAPAVGPARAPSPRRRRAAMEVQKEAQRIMTLSVWKMYHSRMQRGGLRLHRSLQLSLVMRSARELYLSAKVEAHEPEGPLPPARPLDPRLHPPREAEAAPPVGEPPLPEPMDTQEAPGAPEPPARCEPRAAKASRKRRSSSSPSDGGDAGLAPSKKARLDDEDGAPSGVPDRLQPPPAPAEGAFPNLARVLQRRFSGLLPRAPPTAPAACDAKPACRPADSMLNVLVRAVVAF
ncbi:immediate early response gene 2 protein [Dasypus novemcinctus]|uniref:immediate early response gene 2 protein n=1 Tax=Dasypus novemcinctus TaxID=9361 RepID=UPI00265FFC60|nr:immediate early response gene 2 protein [Dasypus novemcinctus]